MMYNFEFTQVCTLKKIILARCVVISFWLTFGNVLQGGMRAVVWTDVFQGVIYVSGIIFVLVMVNATLFSLIYI